MNAMSSMEDFPHQASRFDLRLYEKSGAGIPIDVRQLDSGSITLGRSPDCDWVISDPARALSRHHCEIIVCDKGIAICVTGANGVFMGEEPLPWDVETLLPTPCALSLGGFRLTIAARASTPAPADSFCDFTAQESPRANVHALSTADKMRADGMLLEAFCEGAGLDASLLASEDPEAIMRRAGEMYREAVIGISGLMAERDYARSRYEMRRTTISGAGNNLFKWTSSQRLLIDLLLAGRVGFLSGSEAVRTTCQTITHHMVASRVGMQASLRAIVDLFSPQALDQSIRGRSLFKGRATAKLEIAAERHLEAEKFVEQSEFGALDQVYVRAYDASEIEQRGSRPNVRSRVGE